MLIRKVKQEDLEAVLGILRNQIGTMYFKEVEQEIKDTNVGKTKGFVVEYDKEIVGYASWRKKIEVVYLETIVIKKEYCGGGIGSALLEEVIKSVREEQPNIGILNVVTDADATETISFYLKNGFSASGVVNDEFIQGTPQIHLSLNLDNYNK